MDFYGRLHPKHSVGTVRLQAPTNQLPLALAPLLKQFDRKTDHRLLYRRLGIAAEEVREDGSACQLSFFIDYEAVRRERRIQAAMLDVRRRYGANAVFKGIDLLEGATTLERNRQIGGHKA